MSTVIREQTRVARKPHDDSSREWIEEALPYVDRGSIKISEYRAIIEARRRGWKILPGMQYTEQVMADGAEPFYTYKSLPVFIEICSRLDLWYE